ncbi:hypothetical protein [Microcystis aeruginosa]|nr:hypothetical protein [Microcystis aeruginosa]
MFGWLLDDTNVYGEMGVNYIPVKLNLTTSDRFSTGTEKLDKKY